MVKNTCVILLLILATFSFAASEYDKDIVVKNQSRNDKVQEVFRAMMNAYEEEDIGLFFSYVSEDRFEQDYMTFYDAIDQDIRVYDILSVDTWVDKITEDGYKRFLYVQWDKRYLATSSDREINQRGYSRFLFDEVNGKYKLIELAGNNFWGKSLPEWTEEVPQIAGQEPETSGSGALPDLTVTILPGGGISDVAFNINNNGAATAFAPIYYKIDYCGSTTTGLYEEDIFPGNSTPFPIVEPLPGMCVSGGQTVTILVDSTKIIIELNEDNNDVSKVVE